MNDLHIKEFKEELKEYLWLFCDKWGVKILEIEYDHSVYGNREFHQSLQINRIEFDV